MLLLNKIGEENFKKVLKSLSDARYLAMSKDPNDINYGSEHIVDIGNNDQVIFSAKPVEDEEVQKCANSSCKTCWGKGHVNTRKSVNVSKINVSRGIVPDSVDSFAELKNETCFCAQRRFLNKNQDIYIDPVKKEGWMRITWKIEKTPVSVEEEKLIETTR
jgi:hypothetical protein